MKKCNPKGLVSGGKYAIGLAGSRANNELILMQERNRLAQDGSRQIISNLAAQQGAGGFGIGAMPQSAGGGMGASPKVGIGVGIGGIGGEGGIPGSMARQIYEQNTNPQYRNFSGGAPGFATVRPTDANPGLSDGRVSPLAGISPIGSGGGIGGGGILGGAVKPAGQVVEPSAAPDEEAKGIGAFRRGGTIPGHDLKGKDNVPVKVTRGEAILPVKTVDALGGAPAIAQLITRTNGKPPADALKKGGRFGIGMASVQPLGGPDNVGWIPDSPVGRGIGNYIQRLNALPPGAPNLYALTPGMSETAKTKFPATATAAPAIGKMSPAQATPAAPETQPTFPSASGKIPNRPSDTPQADALMGREPPQQASVSAPPPVAAPTSTPAIAQLSPTPAQTDKQNFLGGLGIGAPGSTYKRMTQPEFNMNGGETYKSVDANGKTSYAGIGIAQTPEQLAQQTANDNARIFRNRNAMAEIDNRMYAQSIGNREGPQAGLAANLGIGAQGIAQLGAGIAQQTADTHSAQQKSLGAYQGAQTAQLGQAMQQHAQKNALFGELLDGNTLPARKQTIMAALGMKSDGDYHIQPIGGGEDETGKKLPQSYVVLDKKTGAVVHGGNGAQAGGGAAPQKINSASDLAKLPKGATYIAPDGTTRIKG